MMSDSSAKTADDGGKNAAVLRMTRSRMALRQALQAERLDERSGDAATQPSGRGFASDIMASLNSIKGNAGAQLLMSAVNQLWAKNPWRIVAINAMQAADVVLKPIALRSPVQLIAGALVFGAVLTLIKPWRLVSKSAVLSALLGR